MLNKLNNFFQRILVPLFIFVWWKRLSKPHRFHPAYITRDKVVKVKGWRTALVDRVGEGRSTITFMFGKYEL